MTVNQTNKRVLENQSRHGDRLKLETENDKLPLFYRTTSEYLTPNNKRVLSGLSSPAVRYSLSQTASLMKPSQLNNQLPPRPYSVKKPLLGEKPPYMKYSGRESSVLKRRSPVRSGEGTCKSLSEEKRRENISTSCSSAGQAFNRKKDLPHNFLKHSGSFHKTQPGSSQIGHFHQSSSIPHGKSLSKNDTKGPLKVEERRGSNRKSYKLVPKSAKRRATLIVDDINDLFTPDNIITSVCKPPKPSTKGAEQGSTTSHKGCVSSTVAASSAPSADSPFSKVQNCEIPLASSGLDNKNSLQAPQETITSPSIAPEQLKLQNGLIKNHKLKNRPVSTTIKQLKIVLPKLDENTVALQLYKSPSPKSTGPSNCPPSISPSRQEVEGSKCEDEEDPLDMELDVDLSFQLDLPSSHSSQSSDEEPLLSLQEMMALIAKPPDTPEKSAFPSPSTPVLPSRKPQTQPLPSTTNSGIYSNNLDQMLQEINNKRRSKEIEDQLLSACKEDLSAIAEYEKTKEEDISPEQQELLQRFSIVSSAIRDVHPGEVVFNLERFGHIFNQHSLHLRGCNVTPQNTPQKTLLWSSPAQLTLHVSIDLFQEAFDYSSPCPPQVTRFLFKMMSVHSERLISNQILQALCDIAITAAEQIVKNGSQIFEVWVPSVADVALVLLNMGVPFVTLFPFENLQPPFTEGDLLEDIFIIDNDSPCRNNKQSRFPTHNCDNILKYLAYCMDLCPRAYTDYELLLLLTVVSRLGLDTHFALQPTVCLSSLLDHIIRYFKDWETMLPRICLALTNLTIDHHNMCRLVQLLPYYQRGKQVSRHLSLCMISKLLDGTCTYKPTGKEFMLSNLRPYLPRLQPSALLKDMVHSSSDKLADLDLLDQQAYYLCYSLLTLTNEASNFQFLPPHQKEQLLMLCYELERYIKGDIRESDKRLYRSQVQDLVARIYTKWQNLLRSTRPLDGKLCDYWPGDAVSSSEKVEKTEESDCHDEEELKAVRENEDVMTKGEKEMDIDMDN